MSLTETILSGLPVALVSLFSGMFLQKHLEAKRRVKDFFLKDYQDMWDVVQNVDGIIQRGRRVRHEEIMEPIKQRYSCGDVNSFLKNCVKSDAQLRDLLIKFSENLIAYSSKKGDGHTDYAEVSKKLTQEIRQKINRHLKG